MRGWPETTAVEVLLSLGKSTEMEANGSLLSLSTNLLPTQVWIVHQLLLHLPLLLYQQPLQHQQPLLHPQPVQLHQLQPCLLLLALSVLSALTMEATLRLRSSSSRTTATPTSWLTTAPALPSCRSATRATSLPPVCRPGSTLHSATASSRLSTLVLATP